MQLYKYIFALEILNFVNLASVQWCLKTKYVIKTRIQWNNGQRLLTKQSLFGKSHYYEPYTFSTLEYYDDFEYVNVCCKGYRQINATFCQPICTPLCPANSQCTRPNTCECKTGYEGKSGRPETVTCQLSCRPNCTGNSYCSAANVCSCKEGYVKSNSTHCEPNCKRRCPSQSACVLPDKCHCNEGYTLNTALWICERPCLEICPESSTCTADGECLCNNGYESSKMENNTLECVPECADGCPDHSFCAKPNYCECKNGHKKSFYGICEPVCDNTCPPNSSCTSPNNCTCIEGYKMINNICQPICDKPCPELATCVKPNKCQCSDGYHMKFTSSYNPFCEPQCQQNCSTFGRCIQPNKCECLEGYEMDEMEICQPICSQGCSNGLCFSPGLCICNPGYLMGPNGKCEPVCSIPCQNASCVEPEICQCFKGYAMKKASVSACEPLCQPECINGLCIGANVCICNENYEPMPTNDGGLSHSNCRPIASTTLPTDAITDKIAETVADVISPEFSNYSSTTTHTPLAKSNVCIEHCQCWEEYDILGPLSSGSQCVRICLDDNDNSCLNASQCKCDTSTIQLQCQEEGDTMEMNENSLMYVCKVLKQQEIHKETTNGGYKEERRTEDGVDLWIIMASVIGTCSLLAFFVGLYFKYRGNEGQLNEYEM